MQRLTPAAVRGSVMGARTAISALGFPAGSAVAGTLSASFGPVPVVVGAAAGYLLVAATAVAAVRGGQADRPAGVIRFRR